MLITRAERYGLIVAWLILLAVFSILRPETFFSWPNFATILAPRRSSWS